VAELDPDLLEWDDGLYEGRRSAEIHAERPDWDLLRDGCPDGESPADVGARADRVVQRMRSVGGDVLISSSGHFLRGTTGLGALGDEHGLDQAGILLWDDTSHLET